MLQYYDIKCKTVTILFSFLLLGRLPIGFRQQLSTMLFEAFFAGDHDELCCAHSNGECHFYTKSHECDRCIFSLPYSLRMRTSTFSMFSLLSAKRGLLLPGSWKLQLSCRVFSRLSMLPSFQPLSVNSLNSHEAPI